MRVEIYDSQEVFVASFCEYFYPFENTITAVKATNNVFNSTNGANQWTVPIDAMPFKTMLINFYVNLMANADTVATATAMYQTFDTKNGVWVNALAAALALGNFTAVGAINVPTPLIATQVVNFPGLFRIGISCATVGTSSAGGYFEMQVVGQTG
jgi:hypothetical protein